jgi:hypothetical protein
MTEIPEEAVTAAAERVVTELRKHMFTAHVGDEFLRGVAFDAAVKALADAAPPLLAADVSAHRAEQDAVHADLSQLLRVLGMGDHARPQSSHEVMLDAINEAGRIRLALKRAEAIIGERDRQLVEARAEERQRIRRFAIEKDATYTETAICHCDRGAHPYTVGSPRPFAELLEGTDG